MAHRALRFDLEAEATEKKLDRAIGDKMSRIVRPPLKPPEFTDDDFALLKSMNIADEEAS